jgi:hypothetical protein
MELGYDMLGAMTPGRMTPGRSPGMTPSCMSPSSAHPRALLRAAMNNTLRPAVYLLCDTHSGVLLCLAAAPEAEVQVQRGGCFSMLRVVHAAPAIFKLAAGTTL